MYLHREYPHHYRLFKIQTTTNGDKHFHGEFIVFGPVDCLYSAILLCPESYSPHIQSEVTQNGVSIVLYVLGDISVDVIAEPNGHRYRQVSVPTGKFQNKVRFFFKKRVLIKYMTFE